MSGYNRVILQGTVGADAEVKTLEGGNAVTTVSIAVNESYTDRNTGERKSKVEWFRVEAWKNLATFLGQYGKKGTEFLIEGRLKNESWEKDGQTQRSTKIVAEQIMFSGTKNSQPTQQNNVQQSAAPTQTAPVQQVVTQTASGQQVATQSAPVQEMATQPVSSTEFIGGMQNSSDDDMPF